MFIDPKMYIAILKERRDNLVKNPSLSKNPQKMIEKMNKWIEDAEKSI